MKTINRDELVDLVHSIKGTAFCSITTVTQPSVKSGGPSGVIKISRINGQIGADYGNAMTKATGEEYQPQPRKWGVKDGSIITHNGKRYLEVRVLKSLGHEYRQGAELVNNSVVEPFLRQVDNPVVLRDYKLESITEITINGETYHVAG
jgi:hypothetical protein